MHLLFRQNNPHYPSNYSTYGRDFDVNCYTGYDVNSYTPAARAHNQTSPYYGNYGDEARQFEDNSTDLSTRKRKGDHADRNYLVVKRNTTADGFSGYGLSANYVRS